MLKKYELSKLDNKMLSQLIARPGSTEDLSKIESKVNSLLEDVRQHGDEALFRLALELDHVKPARLWHDEFEIVQAASLVSHQTAKALQIAYDNIYTYHKAQLSQTARIQTSTGVECWRERRPIDRVGLYIPGGLAVLPSTFLMLGIPARLAGVNEIVVCTPPQLEGKLNPYIARVAQMLNISRIYSVGGAQAIAAMGFGTESLPKTDKIFGPGNKYVTLAKQLIQQKASVSIDMPAGPSEVLVIADCHIESSFVASDLLAQAEHGPDSQVVLLSDSAELIDEVQKQLALQLGLLPRKNIAAKALENSFAIHTPTIQDALHFSNRYAPEHLILAVQEPEKYIPLIHSAGSVFLGNYSPESAGDYASGTNHTLPTAGFASMYSGVSVDSFSKQISFQHITPEGLFDLGPTIEELARIEGLEAHARAVSIRTDFLKLSNKSNK